MLSLHSLCLLLLSLLDLELLLLLIRLLLVDVLRDDPQLMQVRCAFLPASLHNLVEQLHLFLDVLFNSLLLFGQFLVLARTGLLLFPFLFLLFFNSDFLFEDFSLFAQFLLFGLALCLLRHARGAAQPIAAPTNIEETRGQAQKDANEATTVQTERHAVRFVKPGPFTLSESNSNGVKLRVGWFREWVQLVGGRDMQARFAQHSGCP